MHTLISAPEKVPLVPGGECLLLDVSSLEVWLELCSPWKEPKACFPEQMQSWR